MAFKLIAVFKLNRLSAFISLKLASSSNVVNSICKWPTVQIELSVMHIWIEEKTINIIIIITIGIYLTLKMLLVEPQKKNQTKPSCNSPNGKAIEKELKSKRKGKRRHCFHPWKNQSLPTSRLSVARNTFSTFPTGFFGPISSIGTSACFN